MAVFNVSFANSKLKKSTQDYGFLVDQLDILENKLSADGNLSPGDYDLLKSSAQKIYTNPGLTPAQRSNVEVKISAYDKSKNISDIKNNNDISQLNSDAKNDTATIGLKYSNDPAKFLQAKSALVAAKIDRLTNAINQIEGAGDDASDHYNELTQAYNEYNDTKQALTDVQTYDKSGTSKSNFAAYVVTNSKGEITDLKIDRVGANSGYLQTNGLYGGLPVYGKANASPNGQSTFKLGATTFSQSNTIVTGPDGVTQQKLLVAGGGGKGGYTVNGGNVDIDPSTVTTQSYVPAGGWVEGSKGFLYKREQDGSYTKYVNGDATKLGINPGDIVKIPSSFEQNISKNVKSTIDASVPVPPPMPSAGASFPSTPVVAGPSNDQSSHPLAPDVAGPDQAGIGRSAVSNTPPPAATVRAPKSDTGIASAALGAAKGFFGNLFNK